MAHSIQDLVRSFWKIRSSQASRKNAVESKLVTELIPAIKKVITPSRKSRTFVEFFVRACNKLYPCGPFTLFSCLSQFFCPPKGIFTDVDNSLHSRRRAPLSPFFSRQLVLNIQGSVQEKISTLYNRLDAEFRTNGVAPLHHMFNALSLDVASGYLFNHSFGSLQKENYAIQFTVSSPFFQVVLLKRVSSLHRINQLQAVCL